MFSFRARRENIRKTSPRNSRVSFLIEKSYSIKRVYKTGVTVNGFFRFVFVLFFVLFLLVLVVLVVVLVAFFLVVAVVALPLLLLPTGKPPKPPPGPPNTKKLTENKKNTV